MRIAAIVLRMLFLSGDGRYLIRYFAVQACGTRTSVSAAVDAPWSLFSGPREPALLALPWELMSEPDDSRRPLALQLAAVNRNVPAVGENAETVPVAEGRLRVLMVISRPQGAQDVDYRMIARPLLDRLEAVRGYVDLVVLRPPTLEALRKTLRDANDASQPFQVVHFDGHGELRTGTQAWLADSGASGFLDFENKSGGKDSIRASSLAEVLAKAQVPVVVLNACQSGAVGGNLEAAVATSLLQAGVASVVAMAYKVYATAAAEFVAAFYESLFAGDTISAAVSAGRRRLHAHNLRPSPKGRVPLSDWLVPVHYCRHDVSFPRASAPRGQAEPSPDAIPDQQNRTGSAAGDGALEPVGAFVGRDNLFYELEKAARQPKVVVLHGIGGTGKTELAKAFGRWWRDTAGVAEPARVFWHSFELDAASSGLPGVIAEIGSQAVTGFVPIDPAHQHPAVRDLLLEQCVLLICDNFESVRSMPGPAGSASALDDAASAELKEFLTRLAARDGSCVLITSRTTEGWLGDVSSITVGRLARHETIEYADTLLSAYPETEARRATRSFGELMEWLDGHPLSMRLTLPLLRTTDAETLLAGLQGTVQAANSRAADNSHTGSLPVSISYSFTHLSPASRRLLPALSLLHGIADSYILTAFSRVAEALPRFRDASEQDWKDALADAARVGLLHGTPEAYGMYPAVYGIHPALPGYLAAEWRKEELDDYDAARVAATRALLTAVARLWGALDREITSDDAAGALLTIEVHYRTACSLLGYALDHGLWREAQQIAEPMGHYWAARSMIREAEEWTARMITATEGPERELPELDTPPARSGCLLPMLPGGGAALPMRNLPTNSCSPAFDPSHHHDGNDTESPPRWAVSVKSRSGKGALTRQRKGTAKG